VLADKSTYTTLPVSDLERARAFYRDKLGLPEAMVTEGGVMYGSRGGQFFVYPSRFRPSGHTQMSWLVSDIKAEVAALKAAGIVFEDLEVPGVETVDGISQSGPNVWTAFFKDPDENLIGLTQIG
jgi:catechol 2,3-dioxygenase-like lactoylglutathione lyase family enzyme